MYIKGSVRPDWYMDTWFVRAILAKHFRIDDIYDFFILAPVMAISRFSGRVESAFIDGVVRGAGVVGLAVSGVLAKFDRSGIDGAVDGLGEGVTGAGHEVRRMLTGNVQLYLMMLIVSIVVLVAVFAR
jgi:NADH:ubiquinone oxidoreductase subunit 5 (subunit L)/multisubunit Na+/H+ antiporter MnhA subunit